MYNQNPHQSRMPPSGTPGSNFQMPGSQQSAENNPFSPPGSMQSLHPASQQSLGGPLSQQPPSHHSLQPMSNAPATPATPQQQLQQPASTGGVSQQAPHSVGPPSHSAMQQPQHDASAAQQQAAVAAAARKAAIEHTDPITATRHLIIHDIRHAMTELNGAIANLITSNLPDPTQAEEEKKPPAAPASVTNPYSMNPQSVTNPQSVNPMSVNVPTAMSVNPMSVNPPGSVKSVDEPHQAQASTGTAPTPGSAAGVGAAATAADGNNPSDIFHSKYSNFLNICDQVERNLVRIQD
ncbi:hypothetical protein AAVH_03527 [Aphelenchoides avenae]|nr:hypothetical protein AAVH_03527 [Aphelenchus avenae]